MRVGSDNVHAGEEAYQLSAIRGVGGKAEQTSCRIPLTLPDGLPPGEHVLALSLHNTAMPSSDLRIGGITLVAVESR